MRPIIDTPYIELDLGGLAWSSVVSGSAALSPDDFERLRTLVADAYPASSPKEGA